MIELRTIDGKRLVFKGYKVSWRGLWLTDTGWRKSKMGLQILSKEQTHLTLARLADQGKFCCASLTK